MAPKERENWSSQFQFLFSAIGVSVGLGNIWRFPYICYKNGGGAFLLPYVLFLFIIGFPLTLLQMTYAQYSNRGPAIVWECCPLFQGVGYMMVLNIFFVMIYYNIIVSWTLYYLCMALQSTLPWASCDNAWNTDVCVTRVSGLNSSTSLNTTKSFNGETVNDTVNGEMLRTQFLVNVTQTPAEEFWEYRALEISEGVEYPGYIKWQLLLCNLSVYVVLFFCVFKGAKVFGKIMYVAASIPYVFLLVLFIRGLTLPGAVEGLKFFFIPRWEELLRISVWIDAAVQVLYSMGFGSGALVVLASYNKFDHNLYRDGIIIPVVDLFTSLFAGCVVFVTIGYMSVVSGMDIDEVVTDGPGLAFMVYPEVLTTLPLPQLWTFLFFATLFLIGLDSQMVHVQIIASAAGDVYPDILRDKTMLTAAVVCFLGFVLGIPCVTQGGVYVVQLLDWYITSIDILLVVLLESIGLGWLYGTDRLYKDLEMMIGYRINILWKWLWKIITPVCLLVLWIFSLVKHSPVKYGDVEYPSWAIAIGWCIGLVPIMPHPFVIYRTLKRQTGSITKRLRTAIQPSTEWKPALKGSEQMDSSTFKAAECEAMM